MHQDERMIELTEHEMDILIVLIDFTRNLFAERGDAVAIKTLIDMQLKLKPIGLVP